MKFRKIKKRDYPKLYDLWKRTNIELTESDSKNEITRLVKRNKRTCIVGIVNGEIVSSILGAFDGRRGIVHHLSVDPIHQGRGYGKLTLNELVNRFRRQRVIKMSFWVKGDNVNAREFYLSQGFEFRNDIVSFSKKL